jgi:hypothetical protein
MYLEMIQSLMQELYQFLFFILFWAPWPWWPSQESDMTEIWSVSYSYEVVHMYKVSGQ